MQTDVKWIAGRSEESEKRGRGWKRESNGWEINLLKISCRKVVGRSVCKRVFYLARALINKYFKRLEVDS